MHQQHHHATTTHVRQPATARVARRRLSIILRRFVLYEALVCSFLFFFFNDPAPPEIYPFPLHAALPILKNAKSESAGPGHQSIASSRTKGLEDAIDRSEEHTSELQSRGPISYSAFC